MESILEYCDIIDSVLLSDYICCYKLLIVHRKMLDSHKLFICDALTHRLLNKRQITKRSKISKSFCYTLNLNRNIDNFVTKLLSLAVTKRKT